MSPLIYNFTCEITKLPWQQLLYLDQCQDGVQIFFKTVTLEEVTELLEAAENLNARKSTINWVRDFEKWCDENSLEKNRRFFLRSWIKYSSGFSAPRVNKICHP